jgi:cytoskeletal protein CcmA (bactofilin family)
VIYATGRVTGRVRYGKVVIEEGGQLSGEIEFGTSPAAQRPALQPVRNTSVG